MKRKTWFWIVLLTVLAAASAGVYLLRGTPGRLAVVYVDGEAVRTFDLDAAAIPYEETIVTPDGYNTVRVSRDGVSVTAADCPGQDCVRQGAIHDGLVPIVCLPHRLVIEIEDDG